MGSFKKIEEDIAEKYKGMGAQTVYLESTDDEYIIGIKWFSKLKDRINFVSVSKPENRGEGGCKQVITKVRKHGATAFGIIDRDALLSDPEFQDSLWWEIDDAIFSSKRPYSENIFVLHRWELENYLLHPKALKQLHQDKFRGTPPTLSSRKIAELLINKESDFIAVSLFSTLHHSIKINGKNQAYLCHSIDSSGENLRKNVKKETQCKEEQFTAHEEKIGRFAEGKKDPIERWDKLSRMLDGKRICLRIEKLLFKKKISIENEIGILAGFIANLDLIDPQLTSWLTAIAERKFCS